MIKCIVTIIRRVTSESDGDRKDHKMHYILLDLEWNQAYQQKSIAVQKRLCCRLRGEVIQIGAVMLDEDLDICGSYSRIVKPKFFKKMQRHVERLTGITQFRIDNGIPLPEAIERFHSWCGDEFVFITWGPDDIPMLEDNLRAHGIEAPWLSRSYDLQIIFNRQTDGEVRQRSLEYAMGMFDIHPNLPAHDALNDAYFTALVAQKLDLKRGIEEYDDTQGRFLLAKMIGDADGGKVGFDSVDALLSSREVKCLNCPKCGGHLEVSGKMLHTKGHHYTELRRCEEHGEMFVKLRFMRNFDETWRAKMVVTQADDESRARYERLLGKTTTKKRSRPRRRRKSTTNGAQNSATREQAAAEGNALVKEESTAE